MVALLPADQRRCSSRGRQKASGTGAHNHVACSMAKLSRWEDKYNVEDVKDSEQAMVDGEQ